MSDVIDAVADCMEARPRPPSKYSGRQQQQQQQQAKMSWQDVRQRMQEKLGLPFEELCVRLPQGEGGLGIFITGGQEGR